MRSHEDDLVPWRETSMDPSALPTRAADLMDAGRDVPPLAPAVLARIERDVVAERPSRSRGLPLGLRFAMLMVVLLASAATAKGTMSLWRHYVAAPTPAPAPVPARHHAARVVRPVAPVIEPIVEPVIEPIEPAAPARRRTPHPTLSPAGRGLGGAARGQEDPATEAQLLAGAVAKLRQAHDARGALALLDQYGKAFPRGVLASEALSARVEAVLELDDRKAALSLLDGRAAFAGRLGAEQLVTRAELRASAGRYADAVRDFDQLLGSSLAAAVTPALRERALYGRAVSLGHLGRDDRARADLAAYQQAFPTGKHAAEVARLLKNASTSPRP